MAQALERRDEQWFLGDKALIDGQIVEVRLEAPDLWLPVWLEGLPEIPMGCIRLLRSRQIARVPLFDPDAKLRWPEAGIDPELLSYAARRQLAIGRKSQLLFTALESPRARIAQALAVLEAEDRHLCAFAHFVFTLVYPKEVAQLEELDC